ncbi:MAG: TerB family tellurite resistance protein [Pseudomonadota bacterium]
MLQSLRDLFDSFTGSPEATDPAHEVQLATAVLLVEVMRADPQVGAAEKAAVVRGLHDKFALQENETERLLELASGTLQHNYDYHRFTSSLNEHFTHPQKIRVVEMMWTVAYADQHLDAHENHLISKIAGLLHVTHGEYIAAKMRAKESVSGI